MQTLTVDIINSKALNILHELEMLQLIRLHTEKKTTQSNVISAYKGTMTKQPIVDIDNQLNDLRN